MDGLTKESSKNSSVKNSTFDCVWTHFRSTTRKKINFTGFSFFQSLTQTVFETLSWYLILLGSKTERKFKPPGRKWSNLKFTSKVSAWSGTRNRATFKIDDRLNI